MSKKDKKLGMPKDTWRFDPKVDSAVTFAVDSVLPLALQEEFPLKSRIEFTKIAFCNLLEISNYVQAHASEYNMNRWQKCLKWALDLVASMAECFPEQIPAPFMLPKVNPSAIADLPNLYSELDIDYDGIYQEIAVAHTLNTYQITRLRRFFSYRAKPGIQLIQSSKESSKFKVAYQEDSGILSITVPRHVWSLWQEAKKLERTPSPTPLSPRIRLEYGLDPNLQDFYQLLKNDQDPGVFDRINQKPLYQLIHTPYQSFDGVIQLLDLAANSKHTQTIGITCYRLAEESQIIQSLIRATKHRIHCWVFVELQARGEILNHLDLIQKLMNEGNREYVHLRLNYSDVKVHGKMIFIDYENLRALTTGGTISIFSTGNYNESTAKLYTDYHYVTTDHGIGKLIHRNFETIWDSSQQVLSSISGVLIKEIYAECAKGKKGRIWIQVNHLDNKMVIKALKEAVRRKVDVRLIVRTTKGFHKKQLKAKTIVGLNLEHGRIYAFGRKNPRVYISSSDVLYRNLYHRFESYVKIQDVPTMKQLLMDFSVLYKYGQPSRSKCPPTMSAGQYADIIDLWYAVERMFTPGSKITAPAEDLNEMGLVRVPREEIVHYLEVKHKPKELPNIVMTEGPLTKVDQLGDLF